MEQKKYVSKIDGKVFETKDELLNHLESEYIKVEELDSDSKYSQILSKLKETFPDASVDVSESNTVGCDYYIRLSINITDDECETFEFYIGNAEESFSYIQVYETVEEAIGFYERYPKQTELIREALADKYNLESFKIIQWFESDPYDDRPNVISLEVGVDGLVIDLEVGLYDSIDSIIRYEIKPYFTKEIEGEILEEWNGTMYVDGANLSKFLRRAKKVKITIIE